MFRTRSCDSDSGPSHRGHGSTSDRVGLTVDECSPINFISLSVAPGESCRILCSSNQNAWQLEHTSTVTCVPKRPSSVQSVIAFPQLGHVMASILDDCLHECHRSGGNIRQACGKATASVRGKFTEVLMDWW